MSTARVLVLAALLLVAVPVRADDYTWSNSSGGDWATTTNWSPGGIPGASDNATIALGGTYTVGLTGTQSVNNVTLNAAGATVGGFGANFNLGATMTLTAGNWVVGGLNGFPGVTTGGTVTRGAGGTGTMTVNGDARLVDTRVNGALLRFDRTATARLRLSGSATITGNVVTFVPPPGAGYYPSQTGITYESGGIVNDLTVNLAPNVTFGTVGGQSLTLGPNTLVQFHDPYFAAPAVVGREFYDGNGGLVALTNQGTIRCTANELYIGRFFDTGNNPSNVDVTNSGLIEATGAITIHANTFVNAPGGVVRAVNGGRVLLYGRNSWENNGTFEVSGTGSTLYMAGLFTRDAIGNVVRTGSGTVVGIYAGWMDNFGGTWALTADTGNYQLVGQDVASSGRIIGGAITASDGAKLEVRPRPGSYSGIDYCRLTGVAVGPGVLDFSAVGGKVWLENGTTLAAGDTITLAGRDTEVAYFQTQQVDGLTFVLAGDSSALSVFDNNVLTLGSTTVVRKTGTGTGSVYGGLFSQTTGTDTAMINRGLVHVQQGTLNVTGSGGFTFTNRGTVQVDAGAAMTGFFTDGGTVQGGGTIDGSLVFTGAGNALRPGASPGTLTVTGNVALNTGTTLYAELNGNAPGTGHDQFAVTGTVDLDGAVLDLTLGNGYAPAPGDKLFILTNDGTDAITGTFAGLPDQGTVTFAGYTATISYFGDSATGALVGGNDVVLYAFTPVPEPGLALAPVVGLAVLARRRKRSADYADSTD